MNAILLRLTISQYATLRTDKGLTQETATAHQMENGTAEVKKRVLVGVAFKNLNNLVCQARNAMRREALPWGESTYLVPMTWAADIDTMLDGFYVKFEALKSDIYDNWDSYISLSKAASGDTWDSSQVPTREAWRIANKFSITKYPVPNASHFAPELREIYGRQMDAEVDARTRQSLETKVLEPVAELIAILQDGNKAFQQRKVDGLVSELEKVSTVLDLATQQTAKRLADVIKGLDISKIRTNPDYRNESAEKLHEMTKFDPFDL